MCNRTSISLLTWNVPYTLYTYNNTSCSFGSFALCMQSVPFFLASDDHHDDERIPLISVTLSLIHSSLSLYQERKQKWHLLYPSNSTCRFFPLFFTSQPTTTITSTYLRAFALHKIISLQFFLLFSHLLFILVTKPNNEIKPNKMQTK